MRNTYKIGFIVGFIIGIIGIMVMSQECQAAKIDIKPGARIYGIKLKMRQVLIEAADIWEDHGQTVVLTSATDNIHSPGSFHYYGYAVDFRTRYFNRKTQIEVYKELKSRIDPCFYVLLESDHIHVHAGEACELDG
jgi:hypothetical protein